MLKKAIKNKRAYLQTANQKGMQPKCKLLPASALYHTFNRHSNKNFRGDEMQNNETLVFYTTKELAEALHCSIPTARQLFHRADFPALKVGKNFRVEKTAFEKWCSERRF